MNQFFNSLSLTQILSVNTVELLEGKPLYAYSLLLCYLPHTVILAVPRYSTFFLHSTRSKRRLILNAKNAIIWTSSMPIIVRCTLIFKAIYGLYCLHKTILLYNINLFKHVYQSIAITCILMKPCLDIKRHQDINMIILYVLLLLIFYERALSAGNPHTSLHIH